MAAAFLVSTVRDETLGVISTRPWFTKSDNYGLVDSDTALDGVDSFCEAGGTGAALDVVDHDTLCVGTARVGLALFHGLHAGDCRWVSLKPGKAVADRAVGDHPAARVWSTLVAATLLAVLDTPHKGVSGLSPGAGADGVAIVQLTDRCNATGGGHTRVGGLLNKETTNIGVAVVTRPTGADWVVVGVATVGVGSTELAAAHGQALTTEPVAVAVLRAVRVDLAF